MAFLLTLVGVLGICAGFCGRVVTGVAGGVLAVVGVASLANDHGPIHGWTLLGALPVAATVIFLLTIARRARRNKAPGASLGPSDA
jgi:hypothetical protein